MVSVPFNLNSYNLDYIIVDQVPCYGGAEQKNVMVGNISGYGDIVGYFDVGRGKTIRATIANDLEGEEGGQIKVRKNDGGGIDLIKDLDNGEYQIVNHPHHKYCSIFGSDNLDIEAISPQTLNNDDYEFWRWYKDGSPFSNNIEILSNLISYSVVYEAVFTKCINPLSVDVIGPTFLIGTQSLTKAPQYHATDTWYVSATGGIGNYTYQWQYYGYYGWTDCVGEIDDEMTRTLYYDPDGHDLRCVVTSGSETASDEIHVFVTNGISFKTSPNPFNPMTEICFVLETREDVELIIYSINGKKVKTLVSNTMDIGQHSFKWDGTDEYGNIVSSGTYICQMKYGNKVHTQRILFSK